MVSCTLIPRLFRRSDWHSVQDSPATLAHGVYRLCHVDDPRELGLVEPRGTSRAIASWTKLRMLG